MRLRSSDPERLGWGRDPKAGAETFPHILEKKPAADAARECNPLALMKKPLMRNQRWESFLRQRLKMFRDGRSR